MSTMKISQERIEQIRQYYSSGMPMHDIMVKVGVSRDTIYRHITDLQKRSAFPKSKVSPEMVQQMKQMRADGLSNSKIAKELDLCKDTVLKYIGTQPTGCRAEYGSIVSYVTDIKPEKAVSETKKVSNDPVPKTNLKLKNIVYSYEGANYEYKIHTGTKNVRISGNGNTFDIPADQFENLVLELIELYNELPKGVINDAAI